MGELTLRAMSPRIMGETIHTVWVLTAYTFKNRSHWYAWWNHKLYTVSRHTVHSPYNTLIGTWPCGADATITNDKLPSHFPMKSMVRDLWLYYSTQETKAILSTSNKTTKSKHTVPDTVFLITSCVMNQDSLIFDVCVLLRGVSNFKGLDIWISKCKWNGVAA